MTRMGTMPEVSGRVEEAEGGGQDHLQRVRDEQDAPPVHAIGHRAAHEHEGEEGRVRGEGAQAQVEGVVHPGVDEPGQGDVLGPGPDAAEERARPDEPEVPVGESGEEGGRRG